MCSKNHEKKNSVNVNRLLKKFIFYLRVITYYLFFINAPLLFVTNLTIFVKKNIYYFIRGIISVWYFCLQINSL